MGSNRLVSRRTGRAGALRSVPAEEELANDVVASGDPHTAEEQQTVVLHARMSIERPRRRYRSDPL